MYSWLLISVAESRVLPLVELSAQAVACNIPFEEVEHFEQPIPENIQLRIAFWSFPENEEDIRYNYYLELQCDYLVQF